MTSWHKGNVEVHGLRIHYTRTGGAKPPLVLAHGVTDDGLCWTPVAAALEADYDVIMVDARGHGRSDAPAQGYGPAAQADDLWGVIAALELQRPAMLGHSMGAATTLVLAGTYPEVPGAILLEDPPTWWLPPSDTVPPPEDRQASMRAWLGDLKRKTREELIAPQRAATPGWSETELEPWADAKLRVSPHVLTIFEERTATSVDWVALLRRITCPALLITADPARGAIVTEHAAHALRTLVPQLRVAHIEDAGHSIRRDQFDQYLEVVRTFLHDPSKNR